MGPAIAEIQLLQKLTFKIPGQGHGRGQSPKSQHVSHFLSIHVIPFVDTVGPLAGLRGLIDMRINHGLSLGHAYSIG